jgi:hypothetical protein
MWGRLLESVAHDRMVRNLFLTIVLSFFCLNPFVKFTSVKEKFPRPATHYQVDLTVTPDQVRLSGLPDGEW